MYYSFRQEASGAPNVVKESMLNAPSANAFDPNAAGGGRQFSSPFAASPGQGGQQQLQQMQATQNAFNFAGSMQPLQSMQGPGAAGGMGLPVSLGPQAQKQPQNGQQPGAGQESDGAGSHTQHEADKDQQGQQLHEQQDPQQLGGLPSHAMGMRGGMGANHLGQFGTAGTGNTSALAAQRAGLGLTGALPGGGGAAGIGGLGSRAVLGGAVPGNTGLAGLGRPGVGQNVFGVGGSSIGGGLNVGLSGAGTNPLLSGAATGLTRVVQSSGAASGMGFSGSFGGARGLAMNMGAAGTAGNIGGTVESGSMGLTGGGSIMGPGVPSAHLRGGAMLQGGPVYTPSSDILAMISRTGAANSVLLGGNFGASFGAPGAGLQGQMLQPQHQADGLGADKGGEEAKGDQAGGRDEQGGQEGKAKDGGDGRKLLEGEVGKDHDGRQHLRQQLFMQAANGPLPGGGLGGLTPLDGSQNGPTFDISDFPSLTANAVVRPGLPPGLQPPGIRKVSNASAFSALSGPNSNSEFSIQKEDFPALPGFKAGAGGTEAGLTADQQQQVQKALGALSLQDPSAAAQQLRFQGQGLRLTRQDSQGKPLQLHLGTSPPPSGQYSLDASSDAAKLGASQQSSGGAAVSMSQSASSSPSPLAQGSTPGVPTPEQFGLLGLLGVIRMSDPDLTTLALGTDLTTLGLNLNSRENLYKNFASPWADGPTRGEPEFMLPPCYVQQQAPRLQPGYFSKFQQDTLFYVFYSMPHDEAQLYAAEELYIRGWFFHKEHQMWFARVPQTEPMVKTATYERGSYFIFDPTSWETVRKDNFVLQYEMVEGRPSLPHAQR